MVKRVGLGLVALIALAVLGMVVKFYALSPKMRPAPAMTAPKTPEAIARGKYLVHHVTGCVGCHSPVQDSVPGEPPVEGKLGAGRDFGDWGPKVPFHLRAHNLTPDKATGIGDWTDGEIVRAMREGVSRDGRALFPQMPYQTYGAMMSDDDALAVVAYLRTLAPVANDPGQTEIKFPVSMFIRAAPKPLESSPPAPPPASDKLARGNWLLQMCSCADCHDSRDDKGGKVPGKAFAGGMKFPLGNGKGTAIAPNITSDKATGIGAYSDADLERVFEEGKGKTGRPLYSMPWSYYKGMTAEDKAALYTAIRAIPAVSQGVPPSDIK
ncbi:MAG: c-type cytochrome [Deltaproteobacteria bacterium]|nr:c-type cytochrome [Deltaproteobacteria bacterium]